jgi:hypothetical protein
MQWHPMNKAIDLRPLLESWPYDPENDARLVRGADGREVLQVRTPVGLEQLELEGRPDGLHPHGKPSALDHYLQRLEQARAAGKEAEFELSPEECLELFSEGTLYYFRYLRLFQLQRWAETIRDSARNLRLFDFVHCHASQEEDRNYLERWRPYVLRMNTAASALLLLDQDQHAQALEVIRAALDAVENLEDMDDDTFQFERGRSLVALRELAAQIERTRPLSKVERLERQLRRAIETQEFERAAELRDRLRVVKKQAVARRGRIVV